MKSYEDLLVENEVLRLKVEELEIKNNRNAGRKLISSEIKDRIYELRKAGCSNKEIKNELSLSITTIIKYYKIRLNESEDLENKIDDEKQKNRELLKNHAFFDWGE